jgi:hypothetical protein
MSKTELFVRRQTGGTFTAVSEQSTTGNIFWVDSGATSGGANSTGYGKSPASPFLTIDYAVGKCEANNGDVIYVMPGHAESLTGATSLAVDVAGIKIIGLGCGYSMPKLTYTTAAAATIAITAENCHLENLWLYSTYTGGITAGITASAAAGGLVLKNLVMEESANTCEFLIGVSIAAAAHHVVIDGLQFFGVIGGHNSECIKFVGASNFSVVKNCIIYGDFSGAAVDALTAASTYMTIENNIVWNIDSTAALVISVKSDTTGMMAYNYCFANKNNVAPVGAAMSFSQCFTTNAQNKNGYALPANDS